MTGHDDERPELVLGVTPSAAAAVAVSLSGGIGVLDLGSGGPGARGALATAAERARGNAIGVRVPVDCGLTAEEAHDHAGRIDVVLLDWDAPWQIADIPNRCCVLVEVTSARQARLAMDLGADGVVVRGNEAGGRVSELGSFVLLQQVLADAATAVEPYPVWVCGGIGPHTAAAAVAGGAAGVVLDTQLALLPESGLPDEVRETIAGSDGTESTVTGGVRTLTRHGRAPLPVGQDTFLAGRFTQRYATVARAVRAVLAAIADRGSEPVLDKGNRLARRFGTALPVAQGPMTRVSDQPAFAASVAEYGGLPFVALALASGEQTRRLLDDTAAALAGRPWGAGLLGFAPPEVRAAQFDAIRQVRPPAALIAGGRPDQARTLEEAGIATFLHVPSPGLLGQFLAAGARKFVFEGSECGGHVGPRTSFSLWECQVGVLEEFLAAGGRADDVHVLFAGGIHDARSAAMVAALAEPLARRGVGVGVLMGTAYLCTEEAVAHGAVGPAFQRQVLAAERTELLETAPGHATRCVPSPFTETFAATAAALRADGHAERDVWQRLEQLNVGRLRVASKGLRRDGDELVEVGEQAQLDEGLFMAGQAALLRDEVTTIRQLHTEVTEGAARWRAPRRRTEPAENPARPLDIAVVGMSCLFPGATDLAGYWANVLGNVDAIREVPHTRWDPGLYFGDDPGDTSRTPSKWGGFLPEIPFDALRYGIPPNALTAIEPVQLLALETARRALADAGYADGGFDRARTAVVFGAEAYSDLANATNLRITLPAHLGELPPELDERLPRLTEDSFPGRLTNVIAGRIANRLDLGGASYAIDAACGSSLAALDAACKELGAGAADVVLCGGADLHNGIEDYLLFASVGALSPTGSCKPFDASADGIALGEGVACVVLKRLADAERDGDRIYAVLKGVGSGSDGRALGLTAPNASGQRRALERAYRVAGLSPAQVGLLEAHGTGTVVGDRTELETLTTLFTEAGADPGACVLGSVKSQIGHTKCAAGMAGLIKSALAVYTGTLPPTAHVSEPNPAWRDGADPFVFRSAPAPWLAEPTARVAGVSAFGFGGTNFHAVLTGHDSAGCVRQGLSEWPAELFTFRGAAAAQRAGELLAKLTEAAAQGHPWRLRDYARTAAAQAAADTGPVRIALVARDLDQLAGQLRAAAAGQADPDGGVYLARDTETAPVAVLFPGQGSQRPGMLAELLVAFPELHRFAAAAPSAAAMFPPDAFDEQSRAGQAERLRDTTTAQPALGVTGLAVHHLLGRLGVVADAYAGHSYGELVALAAAGVLDPHRLLELSSARAEAIRAAAGTDPGGMAAVAAAPAAVERELTAAGLAGRVVVANHNAPSQVVISGPAQPLAAAVAALRAAGLAVVPLRVACAFHSPVVSGAGEAFARALAGTPLRAPDRPVWTNRAAGRYPVRPDEIRAELAAQIGAPVRFADQIEAMYDSGVRVFVEAGPGHVLTDLVGAILDGRPHTAIAVEGRGRGIPGFLHAAAGLAVAGVELSTGWLFDGRDAADLRGVPVPRRPGWTVDGQLVRTADGQPLPGGLRPAGPVVTLARRSTRDELVADFLRGSREFIQNQREIMLGYLGAVEVEPATVAEPVVIEPEPEPEPEPVPATTPLAAVVGVIARRTGYPEDMIEPGLDLEAGLSVDSIKRTEIAGELATLHPGARDRVDDLVAARTAAAMAAVLDPAPVATSSATRFLVEPVEASDGLYDPVALVGATVLVAGGPAELAEEVAGQLSARGALAVVGDRADGPVQGLVSLHAMADHDDPVLPAAYPLFREILAGAPRWCAAVAPPAGTAALGLPGFFRTLAHEYPDTQTRLIRLDPNQPAGEIAHAVATELQTRGTEPVITVAGDTRLSTRIVPAPLAGTGTPDAAALGLSPESVVLLVGGGRGITARVAVALARASGCRIELAGRTPLPDGPEPPDIAPAADLPALRSALAARGGQTAVQVDRMAREVLAAREVAATVARLRELGGVGYQCVDATDGGAVRRLVKQVHAEHGRIDGVVFAAGVIADKLVAGKDPATFARVYATKVEGARALLAELPEAPRFTVFFGSIAATLGNAGQADYAAANDALDSLGTAWAEATGARALTVHWGPWAPEGVHGGMVSPELARSYATRGISLIDPADGVDALLRELAWGDPAVRSLVYAAPGWPR
ncbi:type I polyketide synthase [Amycolatopsis suaedae]|uniref:SDR family oxidoreductase n=1 Tax=Amycolatopsis suaedae TaxID=2510978 RepID=A0A4Q7JEQ6_9PSEU|nr:type I polyketide synthase [Amycolatopsis suaedae]RZQ65808.1 SDR family oxidoreductase [Amycolatopsis suaedae]